MWHDVKTCLSFDFCSGHPTSEGKSQGEMPGSRISAASMARTTRPISAARHLIADWWFFQGNMVS